MNRSALAQMLLEWEQKRLALDELEQAIRDTILQLGESVEAGNVQAQYRGPRRTYDYKGAGVNASDEMRARFTETTVKVDWRKLVLEGLEVKQDQVPCTLGKPSVSLKLRG